MASSTTVAASQDLLTEILLRLPVKPLFRFNCVSKHWHSLITDPYLRNRKNVNLCKTVTGLYVLTQRRLPTTKPEYKCEYKVVPLDETGHIIPSLDWFASVDDGNIQILQSCNGLFSCRMNKMSAENYDYYICNPTTHQFRKLPNLILFAKYSDFICSINLAFDPRKSPHYKVLCLYRYRGASHYQLQIYSSETGQWKSTSDTFTAQVDFRNGVYWNGAINWFSLYGGRNGLYFNVDEERFGKFPMPPVPDGRGLLVPTLTLYYGESHDHLLLVDKFNYHARQLNLYEMDKEYSRWSLRSRIDTGDVMSSSINPRQRDFRIISVVWTGNEADSFVAIGVVGKAVRYNLRDKSFIVIRDFNDDHSVFPLMFEKREYGFHCIESISDV